MEHSLDVNAAAIAAYRARRHTGGARTDSGRAPAMRIAKMRKLGAIGQSI